MSDLVQYFKANPDPTLVGCANSGAVEDGVVFSGIEPLQGTYCYVGRTSLIEAAALLFNLGVKEVKDALTDGTSKARKENDRLREDLAARTQELEELKDKLRDLSGLNVR